MVARVSKTALSSPDTLYIVMDNCVGQNKSQLVMMFMLLLSMTFYKRVVCQADILGLQVETLSSKFDRANTSNNLHLRYRISNSRFRITLQQLFDGNFKFIHDLAQH